jgi:hypothetical protein
MRRRVVACALAVLVLVFMMPLAGADVDTGMEGLWIGSEAAGQITLMLGSGGTFISIYESDQAYRQAGVFTVDIDNMYLTMTDGTTSTLQYGFAEGSLFLSSDGEEVEMKRLDFTFQDDFTGVWVVTGPDGSGSGLIAMDSSGGFASVDVGSGETYKGIYLPDQGDLLVSFQDCTSIQMAYQMDASTGQIILTNPSTGETMTLTRFASPLSGE